MSLLNFSSNVNTSSVSAYSYMPDYSAIFANFYKQQPVNNPFGIFKSYYNKYSSQQSLNFSTLSDSDYDKQKGVRLANIAKQNCANKWNKQCATYVKNDIQAAGLGKYIKGDAYQCAAILDKNPNFKRVNATKNDLETTPGLVLVYGKGVSGYNKKYGHIEITGGNGCAYSDGVTHNIRDGAIVYAPVGNSKIA